MHGGSRGARAGVNDDTSVPSRSSTTVSLPCTAGQNRFPGEAIIEISNSAPSKVQRRKLIEIDRMGYVYMVIRRGRMVWIDAWEVELTIYPFLVGFCVGLIGGAADRCRAPDALAAGAATAALPQRSPHLQDCITHRVM